MTTVKVKKVKIELDAPVVIWISKNADKELIEHENAHVEICRRFYKKAKKYAERAGAKVIGGSFQGAGKSSEESIKNALSIANRDVCNYFHLVLTEKVDRVSEIFDSLDHDSKVPSKQLIEKAFKQFKKEL